MTARIGFVVIGRNEEMHLGRCLAAVVAEAADGPVLYVDSRSTDRSLAIAKAFPSVRTHVLEDPAPSAAKARNVGWRSLTDVEHVHFVDGDTELVPGWVERARAALADPGVGAVYGRFRERHPEASIYNRMADLDWPNAPGEVATFGGIVLVRRACLVETGGFDEGLRTGEDPALALEIRRRGFRILQLDALMAWHDIDLHTFGAYWRRNVLSGWSMAEVAFRAKGQQPFWRSRTLRLGLLLILFFGVVALGILVDARLLLAVPLLVAADLLRIALRNRARVGRFAHAFAYALHARGMVVPLTLGHLRWWRERAR